MCPIEVQFGQLLQLHINPKFVSKNAEPPKTQVVVTDTQAKGFDDVVRNLNRDYVTPAGSALVINSFNDSKKYSPNK